MPPRREGSDTIYGTPSWRASGCGWKIIALCSRPEKHSGLLLRLLNGQNSEAPDGTRA